MWKLKNINFNFAIAKVEAAPTNPNGYSLQVQSVEASATENNRPLKVFVASIASLIFVVLGVMSFIIVRRRDKMHHQIALSSNAGTAPTNVIEPSSQVASTLAEQAPQPEIVQSPSSTLPSNSQSPAASLPQGQNNEIKP